MLKKNIAVIFEDSRYGGPHSQFLNLAQILKKKINFKVLISNIESSYFEKKIKKISLKYKKKKIFFLNKKIKNIINYLLKFLSDLYLIIKFVKTNESEYLYVPGGSTCIKSILAGLIMKKKILWHIHDVHSNIFIRLFYFFLSIFVWKIIFASKKSYEFYPNFLVKKKITILQSAVFKISAHKKIKKRRMKIGIVANFNPVKNIELFLRIVELFKKEKNFSFYLIGQVWESQINYYKKCKQLILKKKN